MGWIRQQAETPVLIQPFLYSAYRSRQAVLAGNLLTDQIRPIYFKYLAAFGSVLISSIYGAGEKRRIGEILKYALGTAAVFGVVWTLAAELVPNGFVRIFITPTDSILSIAPGIIRRYGISFLLLPFSIFSTYYFQAMMKPSTAFVVSVSRGAVISGILIYLLPVIAGASGIWFTMPITELVVAVFVAVMMRRCQKQPIR